jgi:hypothetical protein
MATVKKVLVTAPISKVKDYVLERWMEHISNLTYENYDILLVDNSESSSWHKKYIDQFPNIKFIYFSPRGLTSQEFISYCQEKSRKYAYINNYDYIMSIECDVFPPLNVIESLMQHDKDVACGIYNWGFKEKRKPLIQTAEIFDTHFETRNMDYDEAMIFINGSLKEVYNVGLGCALISRNVFRRIPFRFQKDDSNHSDSWFAFDCYFKKIQIYADTKIICEHENQSWGYQEEAAKQNAGVKLR